MLRMFGEIPCRYSGSSLHFPDTDIFRLHRVPDSILGEGALNLEVPAVLLFVDSTGEERRHLLLFQKDVLR